MYISEAGYVLPLSLVKECSNAAVRSFSQYVATADSIPRNLGELIYHARIQKPYDYDLSVTGQTDLAYLTTLTTSSLDNSVFILIDLSHGFQLSSMSTQASPGEWSPLLRDASTFELTSSWRSECTESLHEIRYLAKASFPIILAYMLQNSLQTASVMIVAPISPESLAAAAFAYMFAMATAWLVALGGTSALDTLASTSYTASENKQNLGILLQRGIIVLTSFYMIICVVWWYSENLFRALGQPDIICVQSSKFLRILIPGGLGYIWFESLKKYLHAQGIYHAGTCVLLITAPLNVALNYFLVHGLSMGLYGSPVATGISYWFSFCLLIVYTKYVDGYQCWGGFELIKALQNLWPFAKLALLGFLHVGSEWWAFEIVALAAGKLGTVSLAAQSVIMTADQIINTIPFGLGVAESARLGNLLGAKKPLEAQRSAHSAAFLSIFFGLILLAALLSLRNIAGAAFTDDKQVTALVAKVMPYVAVFQIADGLNGSCGGSLRGMGRQWIGALVNCISYYCIALPVGIYLAFHSWGLEGLWMGQCVALSLVGILEWIIVAMTSWKKEVARAVDRLD